MMIYVAFDFDPKNNIAYRSLLFATLMWKHPKHLLQCRCRTKLLAYNRPESVIIYNLLQNSS